MAEKLDGTYRLPDGENVAYAGSLDEKDLFISRKDEGLIGVYRIPTRTLKLGANRMIGNSEIELGFVDEDDLARLSAKFVIRDQREAVA